MAETGLPFGRWRTLLRMQAALPLLAAGDPVSRVAPRVGYETPSAFVAALRRETGITPAAYFQPTETPAGHINRNPDASDIGAGHDPED